MTPASGDGVYTRAFFGLQLQFASAVARLAGLPLSKALLDYTNFYIRFGLGRDFDPAHPIWQEYVGGLREASDALDWTYGFYATRAGVVAPPGLVATFGCFAYSRLGDDRVRLHFRNVEGPEHSPLAVERRTRRLAELAALFAHMARTMPRPPRVVGASWLYNLEAYRRLFPPSYVATAHVLTSRFRHMPLWGQFLDRRGEIRRGQAQVLLERLESQSSLENLEQCFPFQVLGLEDSAQEFYELYGVG